MLFKWFDSTDAEETGAALADEFLLRQRKSVRGFSSPRPSAMVQEILGESSHRVRALPLNLYKRAKLANSFKWRLLEKGIGRDTVDEVTQSLVLQLSEDRAGASRGREPNVPGTRAATQSRRQLLERGNSALAREAYPEAVSIYREMVEMDPTQADALHNLGAALIKVGLLREAESYLRASVKISPNSPNALFTLGVVLYARGETSEAENWLRGAVKLKPNFDKALIEHGATLIALGRLAEAKARLTRVLKRKPRQARARFLIGEIARLEGRFEEAERAFKDVLEFSPQMPDAWAAIPNTRKMTDADNQWLQNALEVAESGISTSEEATLRFAIGKYCNDARKFEQAFQHYKLANDLVRTLVDPYDRDDHAAFVDDMIRIYTPEALAGIKGGASSSTKPVFVVGMPRSGTSLMEQIIASHPEARGAGEVGFIDDKMRVYGSPFRQALLDDRSRKAVADNCLRALETRSGGAARMVDKAPVNSDYLGAIYSVFPNACIIYMRRDPIDTCLSCYFQNFSVAMNFTTDLSDLAHYFRQHQRLMTHWHAVLPPGSILEVPYAGLVCDQEAWTRKVLTFLNLEWDQRCMDFHMTERPVVTASAWQIRQKIYKDSLARRHDYEQFIGPLLQLRAG